MSDNEEEIVVKIVTIEGKKYLINPLTNDVYDVETQEKIGTYNEETDEIEDEDEVIELKVFTNEGKKYLINPLTNDVYDVETDEKIGTYNEETDEIEDEDEVEEEEDEEEEIEVEVDVDVRRFTHKGKEYLIDESTNDIYDVKTQEKIGIYNKNLDIIEEEDEVDEEVTKQMERITRMMKQEEEFKKRQYDEDLPMKFEEYKYGKSGRELVFLGLKTPKTNRVYTQLLKPYGMYDPKTGKVDKSKKPPPLDEDEEDEEEEDLDAMLEDLDAEMDRIFEAEELDAESY